MRMLRKLLSLMTNYYSITLLNDIYHLDVKFESGETGYWSVKDIAQDSTGELDYKFDSRISAAPDMPMRQAVKAVWLEKSPSGGICSLIKR